ncbi:MAG: HIT family protein, partial [Anaerolineales bacterium]
MDNCSLCPPRPASNAHTLEVAPLSISTLYLRRDQRFRGYCLLTIDARHATGLEELTAAEYNAFMSDLHQAVRAVRLAVTPDHMNYECLGNRSPHLHWHIIPRYRDDPRWGYPIWDGAPFEPRQVT